MSDCERVNGSYVSNQKHKKGCRERSTTRVAKVVLKAEVLRIINQSYGQKLEI